MHQPEINPLYYTTIQGVRSYEQHMDQFEHSVRNIPVFKKKRKHRIAPDEFVIGVRLSFWNGIFSFVKFACLGCTLTCTKSSNIFLYTYYMYIYTWHLKHPNLDMVGWMRWKTAVSLKWIASKQSYSYTHSHTPQGIINFIFSTIAKNQPQESQETPFFSPFLLPLKPTTTNSTTNINQDTSPAPTAGYRISYRWKGAMVAPHTFAPSD